MFLIYLRRELRRRKKAALVIAMGLALGIALVITVNSVSAGMTQAQGKVLQSLYGLGTDMTVTKAQPTTTSNSRPNFKFNAKSDSSSSTQSSDQVRIQGFETLASSTVTKVADQTGVKSAVGGLSLSVIKVDGSFTQGKAQTSGGSGKPGGGGGGTTKVQGGGASFGVNSYTVYGVDTGNLAVGPLTSSKITSGKTFTASQNNDKTAVVDSAYAKTNKLTVGKTLTISGTKFTVIGIATADSGDAAANVYIPLTRAQTMAASKNKVTTIYVQAADS
ncbi:ABC transporter permease, partial [Actinacidiphila oryziradicis]